MPSKIETRPSPIAPVEAVNPPSFKKTADQIYQDTLSVAEERAADWKPEKPKLTPPAQMSYSVPRLINAANTSQDLGNTILETLGVRISQIKQKIKDISAEMMAKLKESAERASESGFWAMLKKIGTCILAAINTVLGMTLISSGVGTLVGGAMLASGVLSLANFALSESGAWDNIAKQIAGENEELKQKLQMILPACVGTIAAVIGVAGSVNAVITGGVDWAAKAALMAQSMLMLFSNITGFSKDVSDARLLWTEADLLQIRGKLSMGESLFDTTINTVKESIAQFESVEKKTKRAIEMAAESNKRLSVHV